MPSYAKAVKQIESQAEAVSRWFFAFFSFVMVQLTPRSVPKWF